MSPEYVLHDHGANFVDDIEDEDPNDIGWDPALVEDGTLVNNGIYDTNNPDEPNTWTVPDGHTWMQMEEGSTFFGAVAVPDGDPMDPNGHGTMVAGIIGAVGNNGLGIAGVAWNVEILPVRIADYDDEVGDVVVDMDTAFAGLDYALRQGAKVVNMSWTSQQDSVLMETAMAGATDVMFVCAAGNDGNDIDNQASYVYPACYSSSLPNVISVMATDQTGGRWIDTANDKSSNYGSRNVTVAAPGQEIVSTNLENSYTTGSGTSFAAPHISGAVALAMAVNPDMTPAQLRQLMVHWYPQNPLISGECEADGRLDVYKFLRMVRPGSVIRMNDPETRYETIADAIDAISAPAGGFIAETIVVQSDRWYFEEIRSNANGYPFRLQSGDIEGGNYDDTQSPADTFISGYLAAIFNHPDDFGNPQYDNLFQLDQGESASPVPMLSAGLNGLSLVDGLRAVYLDEASAYIGNCRIYLNEEGGIYGSGETLWLDSSTIYGHNSQDNGTAIALVDSNAVISNCVVYNNTTTGSGAGLYVADSNVSVEGGSFYNNSVILGEGVGGAIASFNSELSVTDGRYLYNLSEGGAGAIGIYRGSAVIDRCEFGQNQTDLDGGAVLVVSGAANIQNNYFYDNSADHGGGAVAWTEEASGSGWNNLVLRNESLYCGGGGFYTADSDVTIENCTFEENRCEETYLVGAAVLADYFSEPSTTTVVDCIFSENEDTAIGHYYDEAQLDVDHCLFYKNGGGDFYNTDLGSVRVGDTGADEVLGAHSISNHPQFVPGPLAQSYSELGSYYLSQFAAGQILDAEGEIVDFNNPVGATSVAVDAGSDLAATVGMDTYTTRTDRVVDSGLVDLGIHYGSSWLGYETLGSSGVRRYGRRYGRRYRWWYRRRYRND